MCLLHRKNDIYAIISLFLSYSEVTVATRSSLYPDQMVTAVTRILSVSSPDGGSAPRDDLYSPECHRRLGQLDEPQRQIPSEDLVSYTAIGTRPREPDESSAQPAGSSGQRRTGPPTEPGFSQGFFSILSPMEFWFLAAVASGLLSWGHLISSDIADLIAQILFKLN